MSKLNTLIEIEGFNNVDDFVEHYSRQPLIPGICMNKYCDAVYHYEIDQDAGFCEDCETNSVMSGFILAGVI